MALYLVEGPSLPAVSLDDMKKHLNVTYDDKDAQIEAYTEIATQALDGVNGRLGRALVAQTWDYALCDFFSEHPVPRRPGAHGYSSGVDSRSVDGIEIPLPPLIEVESVKYYDSDNALQTVATSVYDVVGAGGKRPARVVLKSGQSWPATYDRAEAVIIRFRAGYVDTTESPPAGEIPAMLTAWIKLYTGTLWRRRETFVLGETVVEVPWEKDMLNEFIVYSR